MSFLQKIYYNNKPLLLTNDISTKSRFPDFAFFEEATSKQYAYALSALDQKSQSGAIVYDPSKEKLEKELLWSFYPIHSAGGIVENEFGEVLMIFRRGKWDLPKGKQDEGENLETCAIREVKEETGLSEVAIVEKAGNSYHIYPIGGQKVLKYTAWYRMKAPSTATLLAQAEEKIEIVTWVKPQAIESLLDNSFETIRDILRDAKII